MEGRASRDSRDLTPRLLKILHPNDVVSRCGNEVGMNAEWMPWPRGKHSALKH
jgi:hypothetical protein